MATGGVDLLRAVSDRLLACGICLEEFHSQTRLPRLLPCSHSFCKPCLRRMMQKNKVRCPICRRVHQADKEFPVDTTRVTLLDLHQAAREAETVQSPVSLGEGSCSEHGKTLELYCRECQLTICSSCLLKRHKDHPVSELDEVVQEKREKVRELSRELNQVIPVCRAKAQESDLNLKTMETNLRRAERQMEALFSEVVSSLLARHDQVLQELRRRGKADRLLLEGQWRRFRTLLSAAETVSQHRERTSTGTPSVRTLAKDEEMERALREVKKQIAAPLHPPPTYTVAQQKAKDLHFIVKDLGGLDPPIAGTAGHLLGDLSVTFPAIRLNAARCGPHCSVDAGGTTLRNRPGPPRDSQESAQVFRFSGTCSTATMSHESCYWQVTCAAEPQPVISEGKLLCEVGVAAVDPLEAISEWTDWTDRCVLSVRLFVKGSRMKALVWYRKRGRIETDVLPCTDVCPPSCKLGFLLNLPKRLLHVIDANAGHALFESRVDLVQPLWPAVRVGRSLINHADVCLTLQSGQQMAVSPEMVRLLRHLLESQCQQ